MYPVNFTEKKSVNLTHAHTVCTRPSLSQREGPGDEAMPITAVLQKYRFGMSHHEKFHK